MDEKYVLNSLGFQIFKHTLSMKILVDYDYNMNFLKTH